MVMKTISVSIDEGLYRVLKFAAGPRGMSRFIANAVREKLAESQDSLYQSYREASGDRQRVQEVAEWDGIDGESWSAFSCASIERDLN